MFLMLERVSEYIYMYVIGGRRFFEGILVDREI